VCEGLRDAIFGGESSAQLPLGLAHHPPEQLEPLLFGLPAGAFLTRPTHRLDAWASAGRLGVLGQRLFPSWESMVTRVLSGHAPETFEDIAQAGAWYQQWWHEGIVQDEGPTPLLNPPEEGEPDQETGWSPDDITRTGRIIQAERLIDIGLLISGTLLRWGLHHAPVGTVRRLWRQTIEAVESERVGSADLGLEIFYHLPLRIRASIGVRDIVRLGRALDLDALSFLLIDLQQDARATAQGRRRLEAVGLHLRSRLADLVLTLRVDAESWFPEMALLAPRTTRVVRTLGLSRAIALVDQWAAGGAQLGDVVSRWIRGELLLTEISDFLKRLRALGAPSPTADWAPAVGVLSLPQVSSLSPRDRPLTVSPHLWGLFEAPRAAGPMGPLLWSRLRVLRAHPKLTFFEEQCLRTIRPRVSALLSRIRDSDGRSRREARSQLRRILIEETVLCTPPQVQLALAWIQVDKAAPRQQLFRRLLIHDTPQVRELAIRTIGCLSSPAHPSL